MTLLRPVLEPFLWALFLVMALHPLARFFEWCLLGCGGLLCRRQRSGDAKQSSGTCPLQRRRKPAQEVEMAAFTVDAAEESDSSDMWRMREPKDVQSVCASCYACLARILAVSAALAVVLGIAFGVAMLIFDAALRVKEDFSIYEAGARNAVQTLKDFVSNIFGGLPAAVVDEISGQNAFDGAKAIVSEFLGGVISQMGKIFVELLMLGLYLLFWLCTPMPLGRRTEEIFRRYLFLKGGACICYGVSVGLTLHLLHVELAVVFGLMSFFFCFIPEVGAFLAMLLPVPVILFDSRHEAPFLKLLIATACQLGLKFVFANIIEVKLVEHDATMKMHPVITLLAVAFFGFIWGPTGMLLSVPLMAYLKAVISSDLVPPFYRDPVLVLLEGDPLAPQRHLKRRAEQEAM